MNLGEIFGTLYTWFGLEDIYGSGTGELADYLWGTASSEVTTNQFISIGLTTLAIAIFIVLVYYYFFGKLMHKPSWGNIFTWLGALTLNSIAAFLLGWNWTLSDFYAGDKMVTMSATTNQQVALPIEEINCLQFGGANALVAILFFLFLCLILKWGSRDYSHIPF
jgi:hypothetical protein